MLNRGTKFSIYVAWFSRMRSFWMLHIRIRCCFEGRKDGNRNVVVEKSARCNEVVKRVIYSSFPSLPFFVNELVHTLNSHILWETYGNIIELQRFIFKLTIFSNWQNTSADVWYIKSTNVFLVETMYLGLLDQQYFL